MTGLASPFVVGAGWLLASAVLQGVIAWAILATSRSWIARPLHRRQLGNLCLLGFALAQAVTCSWILLRAGRPREFSSAIDPRPDVATMISPRGQIERPPLPGSAALVFTAQKVVDAAPVIAVLWISIAAALAGRVLISIYLLRKELAVTEPVDAATGARFDAIARRLGIDSPVKFAWSDRVSVPATAGLRPPVVILPDNKHLRLTDRHMDAIIAHELAHVRHRDFIASLFREFFCACYAWHPCIWLLKRQIEQDVEESADEAGARAHGDHADYAEALLNLSKLRLEMPLALGSTGGSSLSGRVLAVLAVGRHSRHRRNGSLLMATLVGWCVLITSLAGLISTSARDLSDRAWAESLSLPQTFVRTLSHDVANPGFDSALEKAVDRLSQKLPLNDALLDDLSNETLAGVPADRMYDEICAAQLKRGDSNFGRLGTNNQLQRVITTLAADPTRSTRLRAALVLAALVSVTDDGIRARQLIADPAIVRALTSSPNDLYRLELASTAHGYRLQRIAKLIEPLRPGDVLTAAQTELMYDDLIRLRSIEVLIAPMLSHDVRAELVMRDAREPPSSRALRLLQCVGK